MLRHRYSCFSKKLQGVLAGQSPYFVLRKCFDGLASGVKAFNFREAVVDQGLGLGLGLGLNLGLNECNVSVETTNGL